VSEEGKVMLEMEVSLLSERRSPVKFWRELSAVLSMWLM